MGKSKMLRPGKSIVVMILVLLFVMFFRTSLVKAETILDTNNARLMYYWNQQPENVKNYLSRIGTTISVDGTIFNAPDSSGNYWAAYTLWIGSSVNNFDRLEIHLAPGLESCLTHEIGHCVSNYERIGFFWCRNQTFTEIFAAERNNSVLPSNGNNDIDEYFACIYDMYFNSRDLLKKKHPLSYEYVKNVIALTN